MTPCATLRPHITLDTENAVGSEFAVIAINREIFAIEHNGLFITQTDTMRQARIAVLYKFWSLLVSADRQFAQRGASTHETHIFMQLRKGSYMKSPLRISWAVIATFR